MIKKRYRQNKLLEAKEIKHKISDPYDSGHNQMETHHIDAFREILIALRSELEQLQAAGSEAAETVTLDQAKVGRLSRMDAMQAQQMAEETAGRGFCPSCGARRMAETAALLADEVFPDVPLRQWPPRA
jgi:hypothetical protein